MVGSTSQQRTEAGRIDIDFLNLALVSDPLKGERKR